MATVPNQNVLERHAQISKGAYAPLSAQLVRVALLLSVVAVGLVAGLSLAGMISMWWALVPAAAVIGAVVINVVPSRASSAAA